MCDGGERLSRAGAANKEEKITAKPQRECGDCRECDFFDYAGILAKIEKMHEKPHDEMQIRGMKSK